MACWLYLKDKKKSLHKYCKRYKYNYQIIRHYISDLGMSIEDAMKLYLKNRGKKDCKAKYFYKNKTLVSYCRENNLSYFAILYQIRDKKLSIPEAVQHYIKYKDKQHAKTNKTKN